jgi:tetratricopeptide (TPR) repeat protein
MNRLPTNSKRCNRVFLANGPAVLRGRNKVVLLILAALVCGSAVGAPNSERLEAVEKDLAVLKETVPLRQEALRQEALGQTQALGARVDEIGKRNETVNLWLSGFAILVTMVVAGAGFATYITGTRRARETAAAWMNENAADLKRELTALMERNSQLQVELDNHAQQAKANIAATQAEVSADAAKAQEAMAQLQNQMSSAGALTPLPAEQARVVQETANALSSKPESAYSGQDWASRGYAAVNEPDLDAALHFFNQALKQGGVDTDTARWLYGKGWLLGRLDRNVEAIEAYTEVDRRFGQRSELPLLEPVAKALLNKGARLGVMGRHAEEIEAYTEVDRRFGQRSQLPLLEQVAKALVNKGARLGAMERHDEAIEAYTEVDRRFGQRSELSLLEQVAQALFNKGVRLGAMGRHDEAIEAFTEVDRRFGQRSELPLLEQVAKALVNKGVYLGAIGRQNEAKAAFREVDRRCAGRPESQLVELAQAARRALEKLERPNPTNDHDAS